MAKGSSGIKGGGGGGGRANTPSGIDMNQFNAMTMDQKVSTLNGIIADPNITVPSYLDGSDTSKVLYALGMDNKPTVVDEATLNAMQGRELFRTVYEQSWTMPPPSSKDIADQIRYGDYTQMSGSGGSAYGRAIYFATDFGGSAAYGVGYGKKNSLVMRAKINPNANIPNERTLFSGNEWDSFQKSCTTNRRDARALFALSKGADGWHAGGYYDMIINRGALTMSTANKHVSKSGRDITRQTSVASGWNTAKPMK